MNRYKIEYYDKSEYQPMRVSEAINANVVPDTRIKNKPAPRPLVAWPQRRPKPAAQPKIWDKAIRWLQELGFSSWSNRLRIKC